MKNNFPKLFFQLVLILVVSVLKLQAQNEAELQEYLPPSPTAQEFIKYGEYPVGMYTGVPNISIPLYTVDLAKVSVPIAISYHSAGIQVDQVASRVGLGWSLNAGGSISKMPRGMPDDLSGGFLTSTVVELDSLDFDHDYYEDAVTGKVDTESDIYHYNVGGYSGKFFFDRSKEVRLIEQSPIDIKYDSWVFTITTKEGVVYEFDERENSESVSWNAGDPIGSSRTHISTWHLTKIIPTNKIDTISFTYESVSSFSTYQYHYSESTGSDVDLSDCPPSVKTDVHTTGSLTSQTKMTNYPKRLKEIAFTNGKVEFIKATGRQDRVDDRLDKIKVYRKKGVGFSIIKEFEFSHDYFNSSHTINYPIANSSITDAQRKRLKLTKLIEHDIVGADSKEHLFDYNNTMLPPIETNGKDYWGYYNGENTNSTLIPKQSYQYLNNDVGAADREPDSTNMLAGILIKITYPTQGYTEFTYEPHRYETTENALTETTYDVFAVGQTGVMGSGVYELDSVSFTPNHSGFANVWFEGSDMTDPSGGTYATLTLQESGSSNYLIEHSIDPSTYSYPMSPSEVSADLSPVWLEKDVTYILQVEVLGGSSSTEFSGAAYMMADITFNQESGTPVTVSKMAGGLRINQIKSYHKDNTLAFSKKYKYNSPTLLTPETFLKEQYLDSPIQVWSFCDSGQSESCFGQGTTRRFYYGGTVQSLTLNSGSPVVYGLVDEYVVDGSDNDIGRTNYTYDIQGDAVLPVASSYSGGIMILKKDWMGGQNKSTTTYAEDAVGDSDYITSDVNTHTIKKFDESYKMYKIVHTQRISGNCVVSDPDTDINNRFDIIEYPIYTGVKLLSSTVKTTKFDSGTDLVQTTDLSYDNLTHLQPTEVEVVKSNGEKTITRTRFADDFASKSLLSDSSSIPGGSLTDDEFNAVGKMQVDTLHQIAVPIQTETYRDDGTTETLISISRNSFGIQNTNQIIVDSIQVKKESNTLDSRIVYHKYDSFGNPVEVSKKDGSRIVYIWGYDSKYPVAKVENATYTEVSALSGLDLSLINDGTVSDDTMRSELNEIRTGLSDALVTTYTYDPLIGVTSITDPRGDTVYYEYDDFGRLESVKDADGNLLSMNQYHYKTP